ncbi:MAG TPA: Gmad2 immunoglobulin-like domain-containing protein [Aeromicrobium sp.]|nr:Gmad2 immunoglobulin-like domain-containing protein [Aeromicrobium sp.]
MRARGLFPLLIVVLAAAGAYWYLESSNGGTSTHFQSKHGVSVTVTEPRSGDTIASPLKVRGVVPGSWSFEASFPIEILDADRKPVADTFATISGDWMTEKPVKFTASLPFHAPVSDRGFVVIHKANPSGDQATDDAVEIPVRFGS